MRYPFLLLLILVFYELNAQPKIDVLKKNQAVYEAALQKLRQQHIQQRKLPSIDFFLFGMGDRPKMVYKKGLLLNAINGDTIQRWPVKEEIIFPSDYTVYIKTSDNIEVFIVEDEKGVRVKEGKKTHSLTETVLRLPSFNGHALAPVLKVLHHEILININNGKPVPNFFVYSKPWYRDATLMAMVLKETGNLHLIRDWILSIRDPFDRNNHGMSEADNLGQVLYLISLVSDRNHPVVQTIADSTKQFIKSGINGTYIEGKTDYALHPVFQTKWLKYGLASLKLTDTFSIPRVYDSYSSLFWWGYTTEHVEGKRFDFGNNSDYPYLVWAEDHFFNEHKGILGDRLYPLTWEAKASDAYYPGIKIIDESLVSERICLPHTWHAAEMFLKLIQEHQGPR